MPAARKSAARRQPVAASDGVALAAIALLAISPACVVPGALNRFVFGKLAVAAAGLALASVARPMATVRRSFAVLVCAGAGVLLLAALLASSPYASLVGRAPRYEGVLVWSVYAGAGWAGARLLGGAVPTRLAWFGRSVAIASLAVALVTLLESAGLRPLSSNVGRPGSLLGNASDQGAFGVLALGVLAALAIRHRDRLVIAGALAAGVVVVLSESRGALAGAAVALVLLAWTTGDRRARLVVLAALVAAVGAAFAIPSSRARLLEQSPLSHRTVHGRELLWQESLKLVGHHPALGVGPSGFAVAIQPEHDRRWQRDVGPQDPPDSPHDWVLQAATAGGVPLALLALAGATVVVVAGRRRSDDHDVDTALVAGALAGVVGYGVALLAHFTSPGPTTLAALLVGVLVSVPGWTAAPTRSRRLMALSSAYGLLALVFVLAAVAEIELRSAIVAVSRGDFRSADHAFSVAEGLRAWDADLPLAAGHAFAQAALEDPNAAPFARAWTADAQTHLGADPQLLVDNAAIAESRGDYPAAGRLLTDALRIDRSDPALLLRRGVVFAEAHRYPEAERDLLAAAAISPASPDPWVDLAVVYDQQHRPADAAAARGRAKALAH